jgi:hypothetical protein
MPPWKDYVVQMDRTFDTLTEAVRDDNQAYRTVGAFIDALTGKFIIGLGMGLGFAVGMAIAGVGL